MEESGTGGGRLENSKGRVKCARVEEGEGERSGRGEGREKTSLFSRYAR